MGLWKNRNESRDGPRAGAEAPQARVPDERPAPRERHTVGGGTELANIGKSISIKGDVEGDEDTIIEGRVEGRVTLKSHHLTIGPNGDVQGEISASQVTVVGRVSGNIVATERIEVRDSGRVEGDLAAPRLAVAEGAVINGAIKMPGQSAGATATAQPAKKAQPGAKPAPGPQPTL